MYISDTDSGLTLNSHKPCSWPFSYGLCIVLWPAWACVHIITCVQMRGTQVRYWCRQSSLFSHKPGYKNSLCMEWLQGIEV